MYIHIHSKKKPKGVCTVKVSRKIILMKKSYRQDLKMVLGPSALVYQNNVLMPVLGVSGVTIYNSNVNINK